MDKFVSITKPAANRAIANEDKNKAQERAKFRYNPYGVKKTDERRFESWKEKKKTEKILAPLLNDGKKPSSSALTKHLLGTLPEKSNPITHSDIYHRTDHIVSAATGHQRSDGRGQLNKDYVASRSTKLRQQLPERLQGPEGDILSGVKVYINGYLEDTTDIEMKRIVTLAGGHMLQTASGATHILTSQQLSGSKTQRMLTTRSKIKVHVVRPEWVTDSVKEGKRLQERDYAVVMDTSSRSIPTMFCNNSGLGQSS
ncbi:uncharacterized protein C8Q71DRAFT_34471 [Rhodofomes roseus]|uniref:BRCT domain-containing protein n=1 Tax=Rhodofomes roseus TaxID=34475 RepID=A0ABQ8KY02_9APHY|nr:uncharacterized protein C8Q71DRAFT_34471 [Rhodofomes roseus]KAH9844188.1 hypothetical protein C8Q71DRAFT_34471 [Rhodofomes roseus]